MKKLKKMLALALAVVMCLGLGVTAFAATGNNTDDKGKITIDNAISGQTYSIYKVFDLVSFDTGEGDNSESYRYEVTDAFKNFFKTAKDAKSGEYYVTDDFKVYRKTADGAVQVTSDTAGATGAAVIGTEAQTFAQALLTYIGNATPTDSKTASSVTIEFTNLDLGYYLVKSSTGALVSLDTTATDVTIKEKNSVPSVDKVILEGTPAVEKKTNDVNIGDTVNYQTTITAQPGAKSYVLHDKMSDGLEFNGDIVITGLTLGEDYTVSTTNDDECTFEITFTDTFLASIDTADTAIVVTYSATVTEDAVVEGEGNPNDTWLDYGDDNQTTHSSTTTYTWGFDIFKKDKADQALANAKFTLAKGDENLTFTVESAADAAETVYRYDPEGTVTELVTPDSGYIYIKGLDSGTYILTETEAPSGYNKLTDPINVIITGNDDNEDNGDGDGELDGDFTLQTQSGEGEPVEVTATHSGHYYQTSSTSTAVKKIEILNQQGSELPSTGGMGTTIFYIIGAILVAGAGCVLVARRRMKANA